MPSMIDKSSPLLSSADDSVPSRSMPQVVIVTGLSGAGKSTALQVLEDLQYFTVDNLPVSLTPEMVSILARESMAEFRGIALGVDVRQGDLLVDLDSVLESLSEKKIRWMILFVEAKDPVLLRRYATTRRPHPLEREGMGLEAALHTERSRLAPVRRIADIVLDTSRFSIHDLRRAIQQRWSAAQDKLCSLKILLVSFGFKYGVPKEADTVFDLRFLPNPYFIEDLRPLSGKDPAVAKYVYDDAGSQKFLQSLVDFLQCMLPLMEAEGRYRTTIAVGCTGGRHRSVATVEYLGQVLRQFEYLVSVEHRHLELG